MRIGVGAGWLALVVSLLGQLTAGEEPAPLPEWRIAAREVDRQRAFVRVYVNTLDTLWNEFSRSQLYRSFAQDPAVAASAMKMVEEMDRRKATIGKALGQEDDLWLLNQVGRLGPFAAGYGFQKLHGVHATVSVRHRCDPAFAKLLAAALANGSSLRFNRLMDGDLTSLQQPFAHRLNGGEMLLSPGSGEINVYCGERRFLFTGPSNNESSVFQHAATAGVPTQREEQFAAFLGKSSRWLGAVDFDLPAVLAQLTEESEATATDLEAAYGKPGSVFAREAVNKSNRFDLECQCLAADLHKGFLFFGAGQPLNTEIAHIFPEELVLILHANYDFQKFLAVDLNAMPGTSESFRQEFGRIQKDLREVTTGPGEKDKPAPPGPKLTHGLSVLLLEADRLEELPTSFVIVMGVEPGFTLNETWVKSLKLARNWDDTVKPVKVVNYADVPIAVIGEGQWVQCVAVINGALVLGQNLKQMKRVARYLGQVKKGETNPNKGNEWQHIAALADQTGGGALHGFALMKMDFLLKTLAPTGLGAGTMFLPDLPTEVNWSEVAGRLQPATAVLMYDAQNGFKGRLVSDLPIGTLAATVGVTAGVGAAAESFYSWGERDPEDLPNVFERPAVEGGGDPAVAPEEAINPD